MRMTFINYGRQALSLGFAVVLIASLAYSMAIRQGHADSPIATDAESIEPIKVGEAAPYFIVRDVDGENFVFDPDALQRPVVLVTFRGGWCPYCNMHLSELRHALPELEARGLDIFFLSGDRPEQLIASLRPETRDDVNELGYTLLSDADATAAIALGIAFRAAEGLPVRLQERGRDVQESSMDRHGILPVPAVFAIRSDGEIAFAHTNADYKQRLSADELLEAVRDL